VGLYGYYNTLFILDQCMEDNLKRGFPAAVFSVKNNGSVKE
jgi:hypothetical protein